MDKVRGGTPQGSKSLCANCRNAQNVRGLNFQEICICRVTGYPIRITFPVETCSAFSDSRTPALHEMYNIAWVIHSRNRGPMGFADGAKTEITIDPPDRYGGVGPPQQGEPPK